ncbi:unnamed protein product [Polarella glacialis]|uniref:Fe2OG dioxygenase domain-containing protein n=1 Tax=Polarella glacialis TaxID=89957 RepID=A0A813FBK9_POLGL|nr:unnamed protein product [Polarella glacialis]
MAGSTRGFCHASWVAKLLASSALCLTLEVAALVCGEQGESELGDPREEDVGGVRWHIGKARFGPPWLDFPADSAVTCASGARRAKSSGEAATHQRLYLNYSPSEKRCVVKLEDRPRSKLRSCPGVWTAVLHFEGSPEEVVVEESEQKDRPAACDLQTDGTCSTAAFEQSTAQRPRATTDKITATTTMTSIAPGSTTSASAATSHRPADKSVPSPAVHSSPGGLQVTQTTGSDPHGRWFLNSEAIRLGRWSGTRFDGVEGKAKWNLLRGLLPSKEEKLIRSRMPALSDFEAKPDSIDGNATHEFYVYKAAKLLHAPLEEAMRPATERAMRFVRRNYNCETCVVCFSLIRRYLEGERRDLKPHQDMQALVSVVFALNAGDFDGGLYLMANYSAPKTFLPLQTGDAVVHQADLLHGVEVRRGNRWSWSLWIKPEADCKLFVTLKKCFTRADANSDGRLDASETTIFVQLAGIDVSASKLLRAGDADGDGHLDAYEAFTVVFKATLPAMAAADDTGSGSDTVSSS